MSSAFAGPCKTPCSCQKDNIPLGPICRGSPSTREAALPADASCEDLDVDPALPFLDGYVAEALQTGAAPYISQQDRFAMGAVRSSHHDEVRLLNRPSGTSIIDLGPSRLCLQTLPC